MLTEPTMMPMPGALASCTDATARAGGEHRRAASERWSPTRHTALLSLDDADLVDRAVGRYEEVRDPEAFGALYERYVPTVFSFALSRLRNLTQAEDVTSQTFLQALQALPRYQLRGLPLRSWFIRITCNLIADLHRAAPARPAQLGESAEEEREVHDVLDLPDPQAEAAIAAWEGAEEFRRLVGDLPPEQRTVLRLRFGDGLAVATIAVKMGRSAGAVKALQFRGVRELRRRWEQEIP